MSKSIDLSESKLYIDMYTENTSFIYKYIYITGCAHMDFGHYIIIYNRTLFMNKYSKTLFIYVNDLYIVLRWYIRFRNNKILNSLRPYSSINSPTCELSCNGM